jgi:hypothetical protein
MGEPIDIYSDQFQVSIGPYGCTLNFMLTDPIPPSPGSPPKAERLATVRTSLEHLKVMTFILRKQILQVEDNSGIKVQIPIQVLNSMGVSPEDWDAFWKSL